MDRKKVIIIGTGGHGIGAAISQVLAERGIQKHEVSIKDIEEFEIQKNEERLKSLEIGRGEELVLPFIRRPEYPDPIFPRISKYDCISKSSHKRSNFRKKR